MVEKYVIKGIVKGQVVYFNKFENTIMFGTDFKVRVMSDTLSGATLFEDTMEAEEVCMELGIDFKIYPVCPRCHKEYTSHPAISRKDNTTMICSDCGTQEALLAFINHNKRNLRFDS